MAYFLNLFSPETYEAFSESNRDISGFSLRQWNAAKRVCPSDKLICYMTQLSRWVDHLKVESMVCPFADRCDCKVDDLKKRVCHL